MGSARGAMIPLALATAIACLVLAVDNRPLSAQIFFPGGRKINTAESDDPSGNVFLPADREILRKMSRAKALLEADRHGEALGLLGDILRDSRDGGCEDYFFQPDKNSTRQPSLKSEAQRLIGEMPRDARELYELQFGTEARQTLDSAIATGNTTLLTKVSRCYFHTRAGGEATLLLGLHNIDQAHPRSGALLLQRLHDNHHETSRFEPSLSLALATGWLQAGLPEAARQTLSALKRSHPDAEVTVAGKRVPLFKVDVEATDWLVSLIGPQTAPARQLDAWKMFRGNASRNAATSSSAPLLNERWQVGLTLELKLAEQDMLAGLKRRSDESGIDTLSGLHPLAVNDVVLMRTCHTLMAIDFETGKRLWEVPVDLPAVKTATNAAADARAMINKVTHLGRRVWDDSVFGKLSSDGSRVFSIEGLPAYPTTTHSGVVVGGIARGSQLAQQPHNLLVAHDIKSGKVKWHIGGAKDERAYREAGTFFLGPPLPLLGKLYVLGEIDNEIRLLTLDAETGEVLWTQQLAFVERNIQLDSQRRLAGAMPSYADGILVCPIANGAVVALDRATRSLLWGYRYAKVDPYSRYTLPNLRLSQLSGGTAGSWVDFTATISGGKVLITPVGSNSLHCLDLADGTLQWKADRGEDLYVGCVHEGNVVLVGRRGVRALKLDDGKPAWEGRVVELPNGGMCSGRGFAGDARYFVPLSSAEVAVVDLKEGKLESVARSRKENVPGNMISYRGCVISQSTDTLSCFYQLDKAGKQVSETLAANPDDPAALALQGEILLDRGDSEKGIASLLRSLRIEDTPRTKETLRDAILDGLDKDFAAHHEYHEQVDKLIETPEQRATFLRLMAAGLRKTEQWQPALRRYLELIDLDSDRRGGEGWGLEDISKAYSLRRDRWVQAELTAMRNELPDGETADLDTELDSRRLSVVQSKERLLLQQFLDYFDGQPGSDQARDELVSILDKEAEPLAAELLSGRHQGAETVVDEKIVWPPEKPNSKQSTSNRNVSSYQRWTISYRDNPGPFFADSSIRFDRSRYHVSCVDSLGNDRWSVALPRNSGQNYYPYLSPGSGVRVNGHLLVLKLGNQVVAIDTLGNPKGKGETELEIKPLEHAPRVLWQENLTQLKTGSGDATAIMQQAFRLPFFHSQSIMGRIFEGLGPVTDSYTCFQRYRNLVALDTLSGKELWGRRDIPTGCSLFGDEQMVFALPPGKTEATVYRALDGTILGTRPVRRFVSVESEKSGDTPEEIDRNMADPNEAPGEKADGDGKTARRLPFHETCKAAIGRNLLSWYPSEDGKHRTLELFDPWQQKFVWEPRQFSAKARLALIEHRVAGVVEPDGRFTMIDLDDGHVIAEHELRIAIDDPKKKPADADKKQPAEPELTGMTFFRCGDRYILMLHVDSERPKGVQINPLSGVRPGLVSSGNVYLLDREGRLMWDKPAAVKHQSLLPNQPSNLPVITFACRIYDQSKTSAKRNTVSILCLDRRTGRVVYEGNVPYSYNTIDISGDAEKKTVKLNMHRNAIVLSYSEKPKTAADGKTSMNPSRAGLQAGDVIATSPRPVLPLVPQGLAPPPVPPRR